MGPDKQQLSIFLNQTHCFKCSFSRNSALTLSIKIEAYGGANLLLIAAPDTCYLIIESNLK